MNSLKRAVFEAALATGELVQVTLLRDYPGLALPEEVLDPPGKEGSEPETDGPPVVRLDYGLSLPKPVTDMEIDEGGVGATLSFDLAPHPTFVPWGAMFRVVASGLMVAQWSIPEIPPARGSKWRSLGVLRGGKG
jgi:hypothetical protein